VLSVLVVYVLAWTHRYRSWAIATVYIGSLNFSIKLQPCQHHSLVTCRTATIAMAEEQPSERPELKPVASETANMNRFAEHVNERKRRKNLWGQYADEHSPSKDDTAKPVHPPTAAVTKGTQTEDTHDIKQVNVTVTVRFDKEPIEEACSKQTNKEEDVEENGFVKRARTSGLPTESG
jgi:hypothetical protein